MLKDYKIRAPYFEIGPKCFMWGERMLKLAKAVDKIADKYGSMSMVTTNSDGSICPTCRFPISRITAISTKYSATVRK